MTLASVISADCDVEICDENVSTVDYDTDADIVGISGSYLTEVHVNRVMELAAHFRKRGKIVCIGGSVANLTPEAMRPHCDVLFEGEGELTWPQFLKDFKQGEYKDHYVQVEPFDMSVAPLPRIDLIDAKAYGGGIVQTTRGCPFSCEFCDIIVVFGRKVRAKPIETVLRELELWAQAGQHTIFFCDDNFVGNRVYTKKLLRELIKFNANRKHPLWFSTQVSIDTAKDPELMGLMRDANFVQVFVGIESPRKASLAETLKFQNVHTDDLVDAVHKIQSYGIWVDCGMIVGFDNDDADIFDEQFNFLRRAGLVGAQIGLLFAVPKTPLYERMKLDGRLMEPDTHLSTHIRPSLMTYPEMIVGYLKLVQKAYSYEAYLERYMIALANLKPHDFSGGPALPTFRNLLCLLNLLRFYCLSTDPTRLRFFAKMVSATVKLNPRAWTWTVRSLVRLIQFQRYIEFDLGSLVARMPKKTSSESVTQLEELRAS